MKSPFCCLKEGGKPNKLVKSKFLLPFSGELIASSVNLKGSVGPNLESPLKSKDSISLLF